MSRTLKCVGESCLAIDDYSVIILAVLARYYQQNRYHQNVCKVKCIVVCMLSWILCWSALFWELLRICWTKSSFLFKRRKLFSKMFSNFMTVICVGFQLKRSLSCRSSTKALSRWTTARIYSSRCALQLCWSPLWFSTISYSSSSRSSGSTLLPDFFRPLFASVSPHLELFISIHLVNVLYWRTLNPVT